MNNIGQKVCVLRKLKDMSQEELAFRAGVSRQTVSKWENGAASPSSENIVTLCKLFNVKYEYLLDEYQGDFNEVEEAKEPAGQRKPPRALKVLTIIFSVLLALFALLVIATIVIAVSAGGPEGAIESISAVHISESWAWACGAGAFLSLAGLVITRIISAKCKRRLTTCKPKAVE